MILYSSLALAIASSVAYTSALPLSVAKALTSVADSSIFAPLTLPPAPSSTRAANGTPGPKYWQNRADYDLHATLDTATGTVQGSMTLRYTNHSPNTLNALWFQTEQNRFHDHPKAAGGDTALAHLYGDVISRFTQMVDGKPVSVQLYEHKTETKVTLPSPLKPGATTTLDVEWHFVVPLDGDRMERRGKLYQIAQWYPRLNVYDDVKGWNIEPYLGTGEFYLEYGDYTLSVTLPADYIVAATGTLDNPREVLTPTEITRLEQAMHTDTVVHITTAEELRNGAAHLKHDGMVTWKFHANNVRDAVFSISPQYLWDATSWKGILVQAYYPPKTANVWSEAADMVRMSIQEYSERWSLYPYPQVSAAEGPQSGGMEYPMISFDDVTFAIPLEYELITHEVGHEWFPIVVGSNERVHAWMDEGINTFINAFSTARRYPHEGDQTAQGTHDVATLEEHIRDHQDFIMEVPADSDPSGGYVAYGKPVAVLQMLRRDVMGPALFDKGLRTYIQRWAYKHPTPQDFFRTMDDVAGKHLDWFWREWFYETPGFDQTIDSVAQTTVGGQTHATVVYGNHARGVLPLLVRFTFNDSTKQDVTYPADVWRANSTRYSASYTFPKPIARIVLDPDHHLVDTDRSNNSWPVQQPAH
jgi:hypothetical protein